MTNSTRVELVSGRLVATSGTALLSGLALCLAAWVLVSGRSEVDDQIGPATLAILGLVLVTFAEAMYLVNCRRAVTLRTRSLIGDGPGVSASRAQPDGGEERAAIPGLKFFHRRMCPMLQAESDTVDGDAAVHRAAGRQPCGMCKP